MLDKMSIQKFHHILKSSYSCLCSLNQNHLNTFRCSILHYLWVVFFVSNRILKLSKSWFSNKYGINQVQNISRMNWKTIYNHSKLLRIYMVEISSLQSALCIVKGFKTIQNWMLSKKEFAVGQINGLFYVTLIATFGK